MPPSWLNKLLKKRPQFQHTSASKSSPFSRIAMSGKQSVTIEPENRTSTRIDASAAPRIFALVVAIDKYQSKTCPDLTGCKNDGQGFIDFLTGVLGVPLSQIVFLADENATKQEILRQFDQFLIKNADIRRDDAIIIFFAGHGSQFDAPAGWLTESGKIETLCTHDFGTMGDDGKVIWGISDRAIDALMRKLASHKGDNIAVIFDCCHSGGLLRSEDDSTLRIRSIPPPPYPPPADLDREIWSSVPEPFTRAAHTVVQTGFQYKAMASHVFLAACRPDEAAMEDTAVKDAPGGLFTAALIECLRHSSLHNTSYVRLFESLNLKRRQHPQCEGMNRDRLLFSTNTLRDGKTTFRVSERGNKLYVSAGSIHGVDVGTEFAIVSSTQRLVLQAKKVRAFETVLEGSNHDITTVEAIVLHWRQPTLRVHASTPHSSPHVTVVPADEPADIALHLRDFTEWELERFDPLILAYSDRFLRFDAGARRMVDILEGIANFNSYLHRSDVAASSFAGRVKIRLNRIQEIQGEYGPAGDDLLEVPVSSHSGIDVKEAVITDFDPQYSFTLENTSDIDLFPYFFYFDPSDYGIQVWYIPPSPTMLAPLKRCKGDGTPSLFALGYGGFGTNPIEFYLPEGRKTDSGFLKVFLTTHYVDMTNIAQSPISEISSSRGLRTTLKGAWTCETFVLTCERA